MNASMVACRRCWSVRLVSVAVAVADGGRVVGMDAGVELATITGTRALTTEDGTPPELRASRTDELS